MKLGPEAPRPWSHRDRVDLWTLIGGIALVIALAVIYR